MNEIISNLSSLNYSNFESLICVGLFGSYARNTQKITSDIDLLIIVEDKREQLEIRNFFLDFDSKCECHFLTLDELKMYINEFNDQLITFFYDYKILYDPNNVFRKAQNLFIGAYRLKDKTVWIKNQKITMQKLRAKRGYI